MKHLLLRAIDGYQRGREGRPSPCRFFPSCSEYAKEAVSMYGAGRGSWLAVRRLMRCRPFGPSGFDPVPERAPRDHDHSSCSSSPVTSRPITSHSARPHPTGRAS